MNISMTTSRKNSLELTQREYTILRSYASGLADEAIANSMHINFIQFSTLKKNLFEIRA